MIVLYGMLFMLIFAMSQAIILRIFKISPVEEAKKTIRQKAGLTDGTIDYLAAYKYGDDLLKKLAKAMK